MQQHKQHRQAQRIVTGGAAAIALIALSALLAALALAGVGSNVYAAPRSGGPTLAVTGISGNDITVTGEGWVPGESVTLGESASPQCISPTTLSIASNPFTLEASNFTVTFTWPSGMSAGTYYLCASGNVSGGPIPAQQPIIITNTGGVQSTPATSTPTPATTTTSSPAAGTSTPGHHPGSTATQSGTPGNGGNGGNSNPGNKGTSASSSAGSLVAIILLCLLVLALLVYLIRIWLQGRQPSGGGNP